uniref:Serine-threonine/tyrosine-protein kinase catalytic domain-containing protein n=1 Tax=Panagrolaimus superbus TaxID=310955 RepID=A0A914Z337_9BILA
MSQAIVICVVKFIGWKLTFLENEYYVIFLELISVFITISSFGIETYMLNEISEFVKEARIMRKFNHPNLVQLIGVAPNENPLMIILEIMPWWISSITSIQHHSKSCML